MVTINDRVAHYQQIHQVTATIQQTSIIGSKVGAIFRESHNDLSREKVPITENGYNIRVWGYPDEFSGVIDSVIEQVLNPPPPKPKRKRTEPKPVKY